MTPVQTDQPSDGAVTVCLVEDHVELRSQLCRILTKAGVNVLAAVGTVREGEVAITEHLPDVAVIDNRLPDGRGIDLCRTLSCSTPEVTLLLHSGMVTDALTHEALEAGATAVISKIIRSDALLEAIRSTRQSPPQ